MNMVDGIGGNYSYFDDYGDFEPFDNEDMYFEELSIEFDWKAFGKELFFKMRQFEGMFMPPAGQPYQIQHENTSMTSIWSGILDERRERKDQMRRDRIQRREQKKRERIERYEQNSITETLARLLFLL